MSDTQKPEAFKAIHVEPLREEERLPPDPALPSVDLAPVDESKILVNRIPARLFERLRESLPVWPDTMPLTQATLALQAVAPEADISEKTVSAMLQMLTAQAWGKVAGSDEQGWGRVEAFGLRAGEEPPKTWIEQLRALSEEGKRTLPAARATALLSASHALSPRTTLILGQLRAFPPLNPELAGAYVWRRALAIVEDEQRAASSPENLRAQLLLLGVSPDRVTPDVLRVGAAWGEGGLPVAEVLQRLERISEAGLAAEVWRLDQRTPAQALPEAAIDAAPDTARPERLAARAEPDERGAVDAGRDHEELPYPPPAGEKGSARRWPGGAVYDTFLILAEHRGVKPGQLPRLADLPEPFPAVWASLAEVLRRVDRLGRETLCASWLARLDQETEGFLVDAGGGPEPQTLLPTPAEARRIIADLKAQTSPMQLSEHGAIHVSAEVFLANVAGLPDLSQHVGPVPELLTGEQLFLAYQECATAAGDGGLSLTWAETSEQPTWNALAQRYSERLFQAEIGRKAALDELARERKVFADFGEDMSFGDALELLQMTAMYPPETTLRGTMLGAVKVLRSRHGQVATMSKTIAEQEGENKQVRAELAGWRDAAEVSTPEALADAQAESRVGRSALAKKVAEQGRTIADLDAEVKRLRALESAQDTKIRDLLAENGQLRETRPLGAPETVEPYQGTNPYLRSLGKFTPSSEVIALRQRVLDADACADALHRVLKQETALGFAGIAEVAAEKIKALRSERDRAELEMRKAFKRLSALRAFLVEVCAGTYRRLDDVTAAAGKAFSADVAHDSLESGARAERHAAQRLDEAIKGRTLDPASTFHSAGVAHVDVDLRVTLSPLELLGMALGGELRESARIRTEHDPGTVSLRERSATVEWPWWVPRFGMRPSRR